MKVERSRQGEHTVIRLRGSIALGETTQTLAAELGQAEKEGTGGTVVDLSELRSLDSTALGLLVGSLRRLRAVGRELTLVNPNENVGMLLHMTQLDSVFPIRPTVAAALELLDHAQEGEKGGGPVQRL